MRSDPARATTLIQRQLDDGTDFFLGSFGSNIVLPTAAITERAKKPMVQTGGGSDAIFTQGYKYVFGMFPRATRQFAVDGGVVQDAQPAPKTYSVICHQRRLLQDRAAGVVKRLRRGGLQAARELRAAGQADRRLERAGLGAQPRRRTCCSASMHDQDSLLIARQMIASGTNVKLLFQGLGPQLASYREALGKYSESPAVLDLLGRDAFPTRTSSSAIRRKFAEYYEDKFTRPIAYHVAGARRLHRDLRPRHAGGARASSPRRCATRWPRPTTRPSTAASSSRPDGDGDRHHHGRHDRPGAEGQAARSCSPAAWPSRPTLLSRRRRGTRRLSD